MLEEWQPDVMYLSTTVYIQHKFAPNERGAKEFPAMVDKYLGKLNAMAATLLLTADHAMKPKRDASGAPRFVYVQDLLEKWLGQSVARVILPITDPYIVYHGALGSFATVYLPYEVDHSELKNKLASINGIMLAIDRGIACARFDLPAERIGNLVLISDESITIGTSADNHDLAALKEPIRSHGGLTERTVPFIIIRKIDLTSSPELRNFDAF